MMCMKIRLTSRTRKWSQLTTAFIDTVSTGLHMLVDICRTTGQYATNDPFGLFDSRNPAEYMVAECHFESDDELMPDGNSFNRHQRQRAEAAIKRACRLSDEYSREIEPVVRSGNTVENVPACAETRSVDHIVIDDHCQTEIRPIVRSLAESVIRKASRPVTIVC